MNPPKYFQSIKNRASEDWDLLEKKPDLAGPWHQLFKQIAQSPRHVISELLQNADDAGATEASVEIVGDEFIFSHDGEDFNEEQFHSLCRFGFSNKRALHTIGFRGIGFKSTFSIGDEVRLYTNSLAVAFRRKRFTEPIWIGDSASTKNKTEVCISIKGDRIKGELEKNFTEWIENPTSLLFFKTIRQLKITDKEIHWQSQGDGPVTNSQWMALSSAPDNRYLHIFSNEEDFPADSLKEIKEERMAIDKETTFPPCRVEIVLGREGRLFVVLFTGVKTSLPFACNAPFIPDPVRLRIKDPVISATNRWLLGRIGKLAAEAILGWLNRGDIPIAERCMAYELWPDVDREDNSLEGACATAVELAFENCLEGNKCLLLEKETIASKGECVAVPQILLDVWEPEQISVLFDEKKRSILARCIPEGYCQKLINWQYIDGIDKAQVIQALESKHIPNPSTWRQLMILWAYVSDQVVSYYYNDHRSVRIVPVQGKDVLYSAREVVRLGEKQLLQYQEDWEFLSSHLLVLNQNWSRFLAEQRLNSVNRQDKILGEKVESSYKVLNVLNLFQASDVSSVMGQVSSKFFTQQSCNRSDCVRVAHIAATLGAAVSETFQFVTQDNYRRPAKGILANFTSDLDLFVGQKWYQEYVLHEDYFKPSRSCSQADWNQWIKSDRSRLLTFVPLENTIETIYGKINLNNRLSERAFNGRLDYRYKTERFYLLDYDFDQSFWEYWQTLAVGDETFWARLLNRIIEQPSTYWSKALSAKALHVATTGSTSAVTSDTIVSKWIMKFRELVCLEDTRGEPHQPAELLRRTPQTEALLGVEPFVAAEIDIETNRPLLQMLGVRDTPTGPDKLLERLRALSKTTSPPLHEVLKWYQSIDQIANKCDTEEFQCIKDTFEQEKILLTETDGLVGWARLEGVYLAPDEDTVPGAPLVHSLVRHLVIWQKLGIATKPTADLAINWLLNLPSDQVLSSDDIRRVKALLARYPERIWNECEHWIDLEGKWTPVEHFEYAVTMQSLVTYSHLFPVIKHKTANLQSLSESQCQQSPFSNIPRLIDNIEEHFQETIFGVEVSQSKPWLESLGHGLSRIIIGNEEDTNRIRQLGRRLSKTSWQITDALETTPYIAGVPAGTARSIPVLWKDTSLYVARQSPAKIARAVPQELGGLFQSKEISDAIMLCYDRSPEFVNEYIEENFKLAPLTKGETEEAEKIQSGGARPVQTPGANGEKKKIKDVDIDTELTIETSLMDNEPKSEEHPDTDEGDEEEPKPKPAKVQKPAHPSLIDRFAVINGFSKDGTDRYYHGDGSWLERAHGNGFHWEMHSRTGELMQYYWVREHCLEHEPLQIETDIWGLCEKFPKLYSIVLVDNQGDPEEISGYRLVSMRNKGELELNLAAYRLVYKK